MTEIVVDVNDRKPGPGRGGAQGLDPPRGRFGRRGDLVGVAEIHVADHVDDQQRGSRTHAWISRTVLSLSHARSTPERAGRMLLPLGGGPARGALALVQIGRASCRERVCQYV